MMAVLCLMLSQITEGFLHMRLPFRGQKIFETKLPSDMYRSTKEVSAHRAIVVGAGPAGLSAALVLSQRHGYHVTVLESASEEEVSSYDRSRAYLYNVNARGQVLTKRFPFLQDGLKERGVGVSSFRRLTVPGNPKEIFSTEHFSRPMSKEEKEMMGVLYWIPRHEFVRLYLDAVAADERIKVCFGTEFSSLKPEFQGGEIAVTATKISDDSTSSYTANLIVGADGANSKVRDLLADKASPFSTWRNGHPRGFRAKNWKSPSVGLRIKTIQLEPKFSIPVGDGTSVMADSLTASYQIRSVNSGARNQVSLTLLPVRNSTAVRPCAICTLPNHELWSIDNGKSMKDWFAKAFPRFSFDGQEGSLVSEEEWERFAASRGTKFPLCQYSPSLHLVSENNGCGIVLIGDAIHCFPPDLGQGVNAALGDVAVLDDVLKGHTTLGDALREYETQRGPECRALIRLARHGAPYQYRQSSPALIFRRYLWTMNIGLRMLLHKASRSFVPKPAVLLMMDPCLSFQTVMRSADAVTAGLLSAAALLVWRVFRR